MYSSLFAFLKKKICAFLFLSIRELKDKLELWIQLNMQNSVKVDN